MKIFPKVKMEWREKTETIKGLKYKSTIKAWATYNDETETITFYANPPHVYEFRGMKFQAILHELVHHFAVKLRFPILHKIVDSKVMLWFFQRAGWTLSWVEWKIILRLQFKLYRIRFHLGNWRHHWRSRKKRVVK